MIYIFYLGVRQSNRNPVVREFRLLVIRLCFFLVERVLIRNFEELSKSWCPFIRLDLEQFMALKSKAIPCLALNHTIHGFYTNAAYYLYFKKRNYDELYYVGFFLIFKSILVLH